MEREQDSVRLRELMRLDAIKHGHQRPAEDDYDEVDFTPAEGRMLILFFMDLRCSDARFHLQSDGELVLLLKAADKLVAGLKTAGY